MYDKIKVIPGIIIFLLILSVPFWVNLSGGKAYSKPDLKYPANSKYCVASKDFMRFHHMDLLNEWRNKVVRENIRYLQVNGQRLEMSLTNTCLNCHSNKAEFCDRCHNTMNVSPYCWNCHLEPKGHTP